MSPFLPYTPLMERAPDCRGPAEKRCEADSYSLLGFVARKRPSPNVSASRQYYELAIEKMPMHCEAHVAQYRRLQNVSASTTAGAGCESALESLQDAWREKGWCPPPAPTQGKCATAGSDRLRSASWGVGSAVAAGVVALRLAVLHGRSNHRPVPSARRAAQARPALTRLACPRLLAPPRPLTALTLRVWLPCEYFSLEVVGGLIMRKHHAHPQARKCARWPMLGMGRHRMSGRSGRAAAPWCGPWHARLQWSSARLPLRCSRSATQIGG